MLYNNRLRRGFLYDKLRNRSRKQDSNEQAENRELNEQDLLTFFKTCVVKNELNELKDKLTESVAFRRKLLRKEMADIKTMFPFYFADPRLVRKLNQFI